MNDEQNVDSTLGHIKSFVIRTTRMSPAQKRGWDQFAGKFIIPFHQGSYMDLEAAFPGRGANPLILDIGFGMGRELAELAELNRDVNYIGVEVHKPGIGRLLLDLGEREIDNVRVVAHDAVEVCRHMIAPGH
ncbi:hypothetical protein KQH65_12875 [archaeon]|nr:hypothetical protein [archaeon]